MLAEAIHAYFQPITPCDPMRHHARGIKLPLRLCLRLTYFTCRWVRWFIGHAAMRGHTLGLLPGFMKLVIAISVTDNPCAITVIA